MLEQMIAGNGFPKVVVENDHCRVFQMMGGTGDGSMTQYDLYPGITLMYNDFHMEGYDSRLHTDQDLLCIDYSLRPRLSSRLTLGGRTFPRKPYPYGGMDFNHTYRYSCLDSHFQKLQIRFRSPFYVVGTLSYHYF